MPQLLQDDEPSPVKVLCEHGSSDLFLTADPCQLDRLETAHLLRPGTPVPLAENGLAAIALLDRAVAVRKPGDLARDDAPRIALAEPDNPEAERIQFIVGLFASGPKHLIGIRADRRATWCGHLFGQLDHARGRRD